MSNQRWINIFGKTDIFFTISVSRKILERTAELSGTFSNQGFHGFCDIHEIHFVILVEDIQSIEYTCSGMLIHEQRDISIDDHLVRKEQYSLVLIDASVLIFCT